METHYIKKILTKQSGKIKTAVPEVTEENNTTEIPTFYDEKKFDRKMAKNRYLHPFNYNGTLWTRDLKFIYQKLYSFYSIDFTSHFIF